MSPLPEQLIDRWRDGYGDTDPETGTLYWHILLGDNPHLQRAARVARDRISGFAGLHTTPLQWLHLTVLIAGPAGQFSNAAVHEMLETARKFVSDTGPITVEFSHIFYHPEAIGLIAQPAEALAPLREAAQRATHAVTGRSGLAERSSPIWTPHVTLCYSTRTQPAQPIIAALGDRLPRSQVTIDGLTLVNQRGAEWLWNWSPVGTVSLLATEH